MTGVVGCGPRAALGVWLRREFRRVLADPELAAGIAQGKVLAFGAGGKAKTQRWTGWAGVDDAVHVGVGEVVGCEPQQGVVGWFTDEAAVDRPGGHG